MCTRTLACFFGSLGEVMLIAKITNTLMAIPVVNTSLAIKNILAGADMLSAQNILISIISSVMIGIFGLFYCVNAFNSEKISE